MSQYVKNLKDCVYMENHNKLEYLSKSKEQEEYFHLTMGSGTNDFWNLILFQLLPFLSSQIGENKDN